jgi:hypothetical protein
MDGRVNSWGFGGWWRPGAVSEDLVRWTRGSVLTKVDRLGFEVAAAPATCTVRVVDRQAVNCRSNKPPLLGKDGGATRATRFPAVEDDVELPALVASWRPNTLDATDTGIK